MDMDFERGKFPGLSGGGGTNLITAALKNRELFPVMVRKRYDDRRKAKIGKVVGFEDGHTGPRARQYMWPLEAGKGRETFSPKASRKETISANTLTLPNETCCQTSGLQNYKLINVCCFIPLSSW